MASKSARTSGPAAPPLFSPPGLCHRHRDRSALGGLSTPGAAPRAAVVLVDADPGSGGIDHRNIRNLSSDLGTPTSDEIEAIEMITRHVAAAIILGRDAQGMDDSPRKTAKPRLDLVHRANSDADYGDYPFDRLLLHIETLESKADDLDRCAGNAGSTAEGRALSDAAEDCRGLASAIRIQIDQHDQGKQSAP